MSRRFSAQLLYCYVVEDSMKKVNRTIEGRIVRFDSSNKRTATAKFDKYGRAAETSFENAKGQTVRFQFVGILDLLELGKECDANEVWYDIEERRCTVAELRRSH